VESRLGRFAHLVGVLIGLMVGVFMILRAHLDSAFFLEHLETSGDAGQRHVRMELTPNVSFLHRAAVSKLLHTMPQGATVEIDATRTRHVHPDIVELIREFEETASVRDIRLKLVGAEQLEAAADLRRRVPPTGPRNG
jgi:carbonic anhydrase